jgi:hypothetical protein
MIPYFEVRARRFICVAKRVLVLIARPLEASVEL